MPTCKQCGEFSNCLTVDSCERCGAKDWAPPKVKKPTFIEEAKRIGQQLLLWIFLAVLGITGLFVLSEWLKPEKQKLAEQYNLPQSNIYVSPKPHGCEFFDAPVGDKHCHFEKTIDPQRACPTCPIDSVYETWRKVEE